jgi:hypothetical protein
MASDVRGECGGRGRRISSWSVSGVDLAFFKQSWWMTSHEGFS